MGGGGGGGGPMRGGSTRGGGEKKSGYKSHTGNYIHMRGMPYSSTEDDIAIVSRTSSLLLMI